jgi:Zn finger protein HypA/HybF involved in hydrogenase expression
MKRVGVGDTAATRPFRLLAGKKTVTGGTFMEIRSVVSDMATASCQNCDRDDWELRKHPSNYSGGGPNCPDCGSTKVNVELEGDGGGQSTQPAPAGQQQGGGRGGQQPQRHEGGRQGRGGVPAAQQPESAGDALAQSALAVTSDEATQSDRVEALSGLGSVVLDGAVRFAKYREQVDKQQEEHAKGVELEKAVDKPRCVECDYVFSKVPQTAERITCPECGEEYEVKNGQ